VSQQQRKWAFATNQPFAQKWADMSEFSKLPFRKTKTKRRAVARKAKGRGIGSTLKKAGLAVAGLASAVGLQQAVRYGMSKLLTPEVLGSMLRARYGGSARRRAR
jgi:hypothetical protein